MDGISLGVVLADLHKGYAGGRIQPGLQYPNFSQAQREAFLAGGMKNELAY